MQKLARLLVYLGLILMVPSAITGVPFLSNIIPQLLLLPMWVVGLWKVGAAIGALGVAIIVMQRIARLMGFSTTS